jgi:hypothetical protein
MSFLDHGQPRRILGRASLDLRERGSKKLPNMYCSYYDEGAIDLITYVDPLEL